MQGIVNYCWFCFIFLVVLKKILKPPWGWACWVNRGTKTSSEQRKPREPVLFEQEKEDNLQLSFTYMYVMTEANGEIRNGKFS